MASMFCSADNTCHVSTRDIYMRPFGNPPFLNAGSRNSIIQNDIYWEGIASCLRSFTWSQHRKIVKFATGHMGVVDSFAHMWNRQYFLTSMSFFIRHHSSLSSYVIIPHAIRVGTVFLCMNIDHHVVVFPICWMESYIPQHQSYMKYYPHL